MDSVCNIRQLSVAFHRTRSLGSSYCSAPFWAFFWLS
uniref:Uncharacterized protein n=1 Tax=Anopheles quadriannulatus TaxID=34691 RepID=A0A182XRZ4_ANOQN